MGKNTLPKIKKEENFFLYSTEAMVGTSNGTWTGVYIALSSLAVSYSPPTLSHPYTQHFNSLALTALFYTLTHTSMDASGATWGPCLTQAYYDIQTGEGRERTANLLTTIFFGQ